MSKIGNAAGRAGKRVAKATNRMLVAAHNGPRQERIEEIDELIKELKEERRQLISELIED